MTVQADGGRILIKRVRPAGGGKQPASDWAASAGIKVGAVPGGLRPPEPGARTKFFQEIAHVPRRSDKAQVPDIEIARKAKKKPIQEIGAKLGIDSEHLLPFGHDKAKVSAGVHQVARRTARTAT